MNKFDEALELLNKGARMFDTYKKTFEYGKKLEILLELYRDYFFVVEQKYNISNSENIKTELAVRIKELEREIKK